MIFLPVKNYVIFALAVARNALNRLYSFLATRPRAFAIDKLHGLPGETLNIVYGFETRRKIIGERKKKKNKTQLLRVANRPSSFEFDVERGR